jgi:hypothetical protein
VQDAGVVALAGVRAERVVSHHVIHAIPGRLVVRAAPAQACSHSQNLLPSDRTVDSLAYGRDIEDRKMRRQPFSCLQCSCLRCPGHSQVLFTFYNLLTTAARTRAYIPSL